MWDQNKSIIYIKQNAKPKSTSKCAAYVKEAMIYGGASIENSAIESAKDYGPWLIENEFVPIADAEIQREGNVYFISGQQAGDVVIVEDVKNTRHVHGHMALFDGTHWVSDFVQLRGFYPAQVYRDQQTSFVLYRYSGNQTTEKKEEKSSSKLIKIVYPIPKNERGQEFSNLDEIMAHLKGEATGGYLLGRNGMWHSGIHITNATTPWCALSSAKFEERSVFPGVYTGEQAVRCMADGEIVAYRINKDYLPIRWQGMSLQLSGSFVLVRHAVRLGETERSELRFYTLYIHLAPRIAYQKSNDTAVWELQSTLKAYPPEWRETPDISHVTSLPNGTLVKWDPEDSATKLSITVKKEARDYGLVTLKSDGVNPKQYWILIDKNNIQPKKKDITPSWWQVFSAVPAKEVMQFDKVVCPATPIPVRAGDSVGHMGFYQAPKEQGFESRYQVHIECFSSDENLPQFLQNPEGVGRDKPQYLKCLPGLILWEPGEEKDEFINKNKTVKWGNTFKISALKTIKDKENNEYYYIPEYLGYLPKVFDLGAFSYREEDDVNFGALGNKKENEEVSQENKKIQKQKQEDNSNVKQYSKLLSQYDFEQLGFKALIANTDTFDHLNGFTQPKVEFIDYIFERIKSEVTASPMPEKGIIAHNYQRLITKISSDKGESYSSEEYRRAFHNPMFSHIVNKTIVKHPSDWYYKKQDDIWQLFLNLLSRDAPLWRAYSEEFIDSMVWMRDVTNGKIGPSVWHMHPLVFLDSFKDKNRRIVTYVHYNYKLDYALEKQMNLKGPEKPKYGNTTLASRELVRKYMDPEIHMDGGDIYQFVDLSKSTGISVAEANSMLKGKGVLDGKGSVFIDAGNKYNVSEVYLIAHALLETGNGTAKFANGSKEYNGVTIYNMYGISVLDSDPQKGVKYAYDRGWTSVDKAIDGGAKWISVNFVNKGGRSQNTLYKMRWNPDRPATMQYATAVNWALVQVSKMQKMFDLFPDANWVFEIPVYLK